MALKTLNFVPSLQVQRKLYDQSRGQDRFQEYLRVMLNDDRSDVVLPLPAFNPMGRDHVKTALDHLLELGVEEACTAILDDIEERLQREELPCPEGRLSLVLVDDVAGQWTHREILESQVAAYHPSIEARHLKSPWIPVYLWASEDYDTKNVRQAIEETVFRRAWIAARGQPQTLWDVLVQESKAREFGGGDRRELQGRELSDAVKILTPRLRSMDYPEIFSCCYGDRIAESAGYAMLGLAERAAFRLPSDWIAEQESRIASD